MKLDLKGVEKAQEALLAHYMKSGTPVDLATAALTAYFDHLRESGKIQQGGGAATATGWLASTCSESVLFNDGDFDCLIIRTGKD